MIPETEKQFTAAVIKLAEAFNWRVMHIRPAMTARGSWITPMQGKGSKGWPDLVLVRDRVVFAELKTNTGRLTKEQKEWDAALQIAGAEVYIWRPKQWAEIERVLR